MHHHAGVDAHVGAEQTELFLRHKVVLLCVLRARNSLAVIFGIVGCVLESADVARAKSLEHILARGYPVLSFSRVWKFSEKLSLHKGFELGKRAQAIS